MRNTLVLQEVICSAVFLDDHRLEAVTFSETLSNPILYILVCVRIKQRYKVLIGELQRFW